MSQLISLRSVVCIAPKSVGSVTAGHCAAVIFPIARRLSCHTADEYGCCQYAARGSLPSPWAEPMHVSAAC